MGERQFPEKRIGLMNWANAFFKENRLQTKTFADQETRHGVLKQIWYWAPGVSKQYHKPDTD